MTGRPEDEAQVPVLAARLDRRRAQRLLRAALAEVARLERERFRVVTQEPEPTCVRSDDWQ